MAEASGRSPRLFAHRRVGLNLVAERSEPCKLRDLKRLFNFERPPVDFSLVSGVIAGVQCNVLGGGSWFGFANPQRRVSPV
jgi:hypothetical protein